MTKKIKIEGFFFDKYTAHPDFVKHLPQISGVYIISVITQKNERVIKYIGSTRNFKRRMSGHHKIYFLKKTVKKSETIEVLFKAIRYFLNNRLESALLSKFSPPLNVLIVKRLDKEIDRIYNLVKMIESSNKK